MNFKKYLPAAFGILLLIICFYDYDLGKVRIILQGINYYILIPVIVFEVINLYIRAQRLRVILNPIRRIGSGSIFSYYSIGSLANIALPALSGQVVRTILFSRKFKITKTSFATGTILEVLFDGICIFVMMVAISFIVKLPAWLIQWKLWVGISVLGVAFIFLLILLNQHFIAKISRRFESKLPQKISGRISASYNSFTNALAMLKSYRHLTAVSFLSLLSWAIGGVIIYLMFMAFGFNMGPWAAYLLVAVNSIAILIVVTPGNVGTFNLACALGLSLFGVDKTEAISFSVLLYVVNFLPIVFAGLLFTFREGVSLSGLKGNATVRGH
ncbi:MAG: flippase-like domain-containing protein [candidate division Zixibacteria bacterium]|nr:flippase-like domain-containing protein [candidate division Zixibacteria bacterium]